MTHFHRLCFFLLFFAFSTKADVLVDLYESEISVSDRRDATFNQAVEEGLSKVIVRLSGNKTVLKLPKIIQLVNLFR